MKAEELMIGDWVLTLDSTHKEKVFAQVDAIEEGKHSILVTRECSNWFVDIDWIEPIPLTPEILEKNGWKRQSFGDMVLVTKKPERRLVYHADNMLTITRDDSTYERRKRKVLLSMFTDYVHEFQHRLKECGIKDDIVI